MELENITNEEWQKVWDINVKYINKLESKLDRIRQWCDAYPIDIFPEPDFKKVHQLLKENSMSLDSITASNIRYALRGIVKIIEED